MLNRFARRAACLFLFLSVTSACSTPSRGRGQARFETESGQATNRSSSLKGAPASGEILVAPFGVAASPVPLPSNQPTSVTRGSFLIFGPGLARSWAAVGIIEAFEAAREPIVGVAGLEAGALIAAAYARSGSASRLRWDLMGFSGKLFYDAPRFGLRWMERPVSAEPLAKALTKLFGNDLTEALKVPVRIAGRNVQREGILAQRVLESFWNPVLFDPQSNAWSGESFDPRDSWGRLVEGIRAESEARVWIFDWIEAEPKAEKADSFAARYAEGLKGLMQAYRPPLFFGPGFRVVKVDLQGIGYLDFDKRGDAAFRGKVAARNALAEAAKTQAAAPSSGLEP